jgi:hypothetical protein
MVTQKQVLEKRRPRSAPSSRTMPAAARARREGSLVEPIHVVHPGVETCTECPLLPGCSPARFGATKGVKKKQCNE